MKNFKLLAVMVICVASLSAFTTAKKANVSQIYGWALTTSTCQLELVDFGFICDSNSYGQLCTISGLTAYSDSFSCNYQLGIHVLRREL